ncbi:MAG: DUF4405 domain-containing protein [Nanoarchaeota archaeon]|nr:DUF4405 domain-containing protein [Nanoarchaeota archaeon]
MNRNTLNYMIDIGLAITFLISSVTGIIKFKQIFRITGISYSSLPMYEISVLHDWSGIIMALLVLIHIVLHWSWIVCTTKGFFNKGKKCK